MRTLIKNALIIPMKNDHEFFIGDILIEDGKICYVGPGKNDKADEVIDASCMIALPAFINAHTHMAMILMRNYKDDKENLQEWLSEIFPIEDKLTEEDVYKASRLAVAELIKGGATTFADMYSFSHETAKAVKEAGINASLGLAITGDENDTEGRIRERFPLMKKEVEDYPRITFNIAPHAIYTTAGESYHRAKEFAEEENLVFYTHLSETEKEVEDCLRENHLRPLDYLDKIGAISRNNTVLAHGVHLNDEELKKVKEYGLSIVNNPASNMKLVSGALDVEKLLSLGINVALGTDGASSNNRLNMLKEMNIAALSASLKGGKPVDAYQILKMATINGAKALHLDSRLGSLEVGKDADIILMRTDSIGMTPLNNPFSAIVYSSSSEDIKTVFSAGRKVLENRMITYAYENKIRKDVNLAWQDIMRR